jgi:hypothetical protein
MVKLLLIVGFAAAMMTLGFAAANAGVPAGADGVNRVAALSE